MKTKTLTIALVAHDSRKEELIDWCRYNLNALSKHHLIATGTTARLLLEMIDIEEQLSYGNEEAINNIKIEGLLSGPLGGDQQIGAGIAEGKVDALIFFCDNLITQGHSQDIMALSRLASLYNIPFATNRSTADMLITSPLFGNEEYSPIIPRAIDNYANRNLNAN